MRTMESTTVVEEISVDEGVAMLRAQVSDRLGISLERFFSNLDAGEYDDSDDETVLRLVMLSPFARVA